MVENPAPPCQTPAMQYWKFFTEPSPGTAVNICPDRAFCWASASSSMLQCQSQGPAPGPSLSVVLCTGPFVMRALASGRMKITTTSCTVLSAGESLPFLFQELAKLIQAGAQPSACWLKTARHLGALVTLSLRGPSAASRKEAKQKLGLSELPQ